jgi:undecaprenyl-diphosphatase
MILKQHITILVMILFFLTLTGHKTFPQSPPSDVLTTSTGNSQLGVFNWDRNLLLLINSNHNEFLDSIMWQASRTWIWLPFYLFIVILIIYYSRWQAVPLLFLIVVLISFSDQLASGLFKPLFHRLRPSHEPGLENLLHLVNSYRGGMYGFISSHACNVFALAFYLFFTFDSKVKWLKYILFPWAFLVSYSRVYLGVHYPTDILVAAILSLPIAYMVSRIHFYILNKYMKSPSTE